MVLYGTQVFDLYFLLDFPDIDRRLRGGPDVLSEVRDGIGSVRILLGQNMNSCQGALVLQQTMHEE